jgi:lysophospholipid hydrolase
MGDAPLSTTTASSFHYSIRPNVNVTYSPAGPESSLSMLGGLLLGIFTIVPSILYWTISFVTLTLPAWIFNFLSTSLTFTMNMTTLLLLLVAFASTVSWFVRYRFLNMYSRLPPEPQRKEPQIEIFPDAQESDGKPGLASYFDEFLSAIKVFGYLERSVFHELTRTMQTRKLIAGETILLEEEKGFCLVVDGLVQIFVKANREAEESNHEDDNHDDRASGNKSYQLLTEVKNGAPMSSLFSVLSLFTDNVKLRYDDEDDAQDMAGSGSNLKQHFQNARHPFHTDGEATPESIPPSPAPWQSSASRPVSSHKRLSMLNGSHPGSLRDPPPLELDVDSPEEALQDHSRRPSFLRSGSFRQRRPKKQFSAHPDIVARATVDTTIAIIPASAFHRITRIHPKATAHIVQVILTRLQRVTLSTAHAYLGLTSEVLRTERLMEKFTRYDLPDFLRGEALQRLKDKFRKDQERMGAEESMKGIALHNPRVAERRRRTSSNLRRDAAFQARMAASRETLSAADFDDRNGVSAGDLLTNIHAARTPPGRKREFGSFSNPYSTPRHANGDVAGGTASRPTTRDSFHVDTNPRAHMHRQESMDEDVLFRESIMD